MTVTDKLLQINQAKQDMKTAIETKGIPMTNVAFAEYANKILDISGGGGGVEEYFNYVKLYYDLTGNSTLFENAWESSLAVDPLEISENSLQSSPRGRAQYPNGEIEGVIIPNGVTNIGENAFRQWSSNNQLLVIPNSVTSIGASAFQNWLQNKQPLVIPNNVTSIGASAFVNWVTNGHPVTIPSGVTEIGNRAFNSWNYAKEFILESEIPPTIANFTFSSSNNAPIYVPDESVDDYKTATNWVSLASRIFPISDK